MQRAEIFLNGLIGQSSDIFSFEPFFTVEDLQRMLDENKSATHLTVHITSNGGKVNDAFAMYDKLTNSGKKITTIGEGIVASAATILLLAGEKRQMTKYATLMIHNPYGEVGGHAEDLQRAADELQRIEDKISKFYADHTGHPVTDFSKWMDKETYMSADEAMNLGFINEVVEPIKAVASISISNPQNTNFQFMKSILDEVKNTLRDIKAQFTGTPKALDLTTADGRKLTAETDKAEISEGDTVTIDNKAAEAGEYTIPAINKVVTVAAGKISAIKDVTAETPGASENEDDPEVLNALKAENQTLKAENLKLQTAVRENEKGLKEVKDQLAEINSMITSDGFKPTNRTRQFATGARNNATTDPENKVSAAQERRATYKKPDDKK